MHVGDAYACNHTNAPEDDATYAAHVTMLYAAMQQKELAGPQSCEAGDWGDRRTLGVPVVLLLYTRPWWDRKTSSISQRIHAAAQAYPVSVSVSVLVSTSISVSRRH